MEGISFDVRIDPIVFVHILLFFVCLKGYIINALCMMLEICKSARKENNHLHLLKKYFIRAQKGEKESPKLSGLFSSDHREQICSHRQNGNFHNPATESKLRLRNFGLHHGIRPLGPHGLHRGRLHHGLHLEI